MYKIILAYSLDDGASWNTPTSTALSGGDFYAEDIAIHVAPEIVIDDMFQQKRKLRRIFDGRIKVRIRFDFGEFDETKDPLHARFVWLQDWLRQPLLRISTDGVSFDGRSYFSSLSNTYYVVPESDGNEPDNNLETVKRFTISLEVAETI